MGTLADQLADGNLLAGPGAGGADLALVFARRFQPAVSGAAVTAASDPDTAEDAAQRTLEQACRHARVYDIRRGSVRGWLTTIARSLAAEVIRARTSVDLEDLPALRTAITHALERLVAAHHNAADPRGVLTRLPAAQARALAMADSYGMTARQIADAEGIPQHGEDPDQEWHVAATVAFLLRGGADDE
jgi:DNA-directed RNA polymerase specialized sigma24 family protein